jgi:acyl-CoA reductase-like NAD-dependent aldehyde dehydrogenase
VSTRVPVKKTYKLFIGGGFPRSESGRSFAVDGNNVAQGSRKDLRDAVRVAREAQVKWAGATAYNRGQVLFRIAEVLEGRREQFGAISPDENIDDAVDRLVWYSSGTPGGRTRSPRSAGRATPSRDRSGT